MANSQPYTKIKVADALKALGKELVGVKVQVAKRVKVKDEDGKERDAMETKLAPLGAEHVVSAKKWQNGQVTITTIDGRKYPENVNVVADRDDEEPAGK